MEERQLMVVLVILGQHRGKHMLVVVAVCLGQSPCMSVACLLPARISVCVIFIEDSDAHTHTHTLALSLRLAPRSSSSCSREKEGERREVAHDTYGTYEYEQDEDGVQMRKDAREENETVSLKHRYEA